MDMPVNFQLTPDESCTGVTEECGLWTRMIESCPPDNTSQIHFKLKVGNEGLAPTPMVLLQEGRFAALISQVSE